MLSQNYGLLPSDTKRGPLMGPLFTRGGGLIHSRSCNFFVSTFSSLLKMYVKNLIILSPAEAREALQSLHSHESRGADGVGSPSALISTAEFLEMLGRVRK